MLWKLYRGVDEKNEKFLVIRVYKTNEFLIPYKYIYNIIIPDTTTEILFIRKRSLLEISDNKNNADRDNIGKHFSMLARNQFNIINFVHVRDVEFFIVAYNSICFHVITR